MSDRLKLFLKILEAEIEDLLGDIVAVEDKSRSRFDKNEIGDYVYHENEALLVHEEKCLQFVKLRMETLDPDSFPDLKTLVDNIKADIKDHVKKQEYPEAVYAFMDRKISKVFSYIDLSAS